MIDLHLGDCLEVMKSIPDESVDALVTDPPYGTNDGKGKVIRRGQTDTPFNVIDWDKELPLEYLKEVSRVLKPDTWGAIFTDNIAITDLWNRLETEGLYPRNTFYWIKYNKAPTPRFNFKSCIETAVFFTKGRTNRKWNGGGNQRNYIEMPFISASEKVDHPTQKPVSLMTHIIGLITDPGDTILDPFMGSGTTGVSCIQVGREFIGIEIDPAYYAIAKHRIDEARLQIPLPLQEREK